MDSGDLAILMPMLGLALGSTFGTMDQIMPFCFTTVSLLAVFLVLYKGITAMGFGVLGLAWGSVFAAMADLIGYDFVMLMWATFFFVQLSSDSNPNHPGRLSPTRLVLTPLFLITVLGVLYTAYPDFSNNTGNGFASNWLGCQTSCSITAISLLAPSIFAPLATGNLFGFFQGLFATVSGVSTVLSLVSGILFIFLGLGVEVGVLTSFIEIDDAGVRLCQSIGIAMLLYSGVNALFGNYTNALSSGWGLNLMLPIAFVSVTFYGAYLQGKDVTTGGGL
jgi:hypothetical protein